MNAVISGQAETAFVLDGDRAWSIDVRETETDVPRRPAEFSRLFADVDDAQFIEDVSREDIVETLENAVDHKTALYLALMLFDGETDDDIRVEAVQELSDGVRGGSPVFPFPAYVPSPIFSPLYNILSDLYEFFSNFFGNCFCNRAMVTVSGYALVDMFFCH